MVPDYGIDEGSSAQIPRTPNFLVPLDHTNAGFFVLSEHRHAGTSKILVPSRQKHAGLPDFCAFWTLT